jgi:hypothetical protein
LAPLRPLLYSLGCVHSSFPRRLPPPSFKGPGLAKVPDALRGENHYRAKMTQADVDELREDRARGMSVEDCFLKYRERNGISYGQVRKILDGTSWK